MKYLRLSIYLALIIFLVYALSTDFFKSPVQRIEKLLKSPLLTDVGNIQASYDAGFQGSSFFLALDTSTQKFPELVTQFCGTADGGLEPEYNQTAQWLYNDKKPDWWLPDVSSIWISGRCSPIANLAIDVDIFVIKTSANSYRVFMHGISP